MGLCHGRESNRVVETPSTRLFTAIRQQTIDSGAGGWKGKKGAELALLRLNEILSHFISSQRRCESNSILQFVALNLQICECDRICIHFNITLSFLLCPHSFCNRSQIARFIGSLDPTQAPKPLSTACWEQFAARTALCLAQTPQGLLSAHTS